MKLALYFDANYCDLASDIYNDTVQQSFPEIENIKMFVGGNEIGLS
jgi:hypothetical protein